jgi:hypothetical protein
VGASHQTGWTALIAKLLDQLGEAQLPGEALPKRSRVEPDEAQPKASRADTKRKGEAQPKASRADTKRKPPEDHP